MMKQLVSPVLLLILFLQCTRTSGQSSAPAPAPAGPTNITAILEKAGQYTTFIRLLKSTQMDDRINIQLNNSNQGLTIFAPTDNAFSNLKAGTLNSFTDQQKAQLVQFHVVSSFLSTSQFQTVSNPVSTQAGGSNSGDFSLNITTSGNQVNMTSGLTNTSVANTVYTDGQLAVYQIDQVLLPMGVVRPSAPPPETPKPKKAASPSDAPSDSTPASVDSSDATRLCFPRNPPITVSFAVAVAAALHLWL
ncbi:hypothetical protein VitviT2T_012103 [Vitis vinifera]|uniref:FAS1 domain-containing protein n=2 Tax=Vitis vinifera TaxID=29760 RepID=A0ABY9CEF2_VITVI|nr:fasciclin-like arabinogalactan protein 11 [Vitis vinifera]WJZ93142.1 hypothetical protein VitviT2T_012103 [Vitis vinifera]|eukprot:XP_002280829.1 PREDICTED: fasciclin-like arabinogalactan protein 11 [Vitis vinifera]